MGNDDRKEINRNASGKVVSLLQSEGQLRSDFESFMNSLVAVRYSLERNEHKEYKQIAVFHMWTGYCIANAV